ncbi:MAG: hypothetical protein KGZ87_02365 [Bacteroidetes bacterium]|nr:hypothetical protein [Bacteroidota bacterium]
MIVVLQRTYYQNGTHGTIFVNGEEVCHTIELPWLNNKRQVSCIPEGSYMLRKRYNQKFKWHLALEAVKGRSGILIHPANDAKKELLGCIAPVLYHTGIGKGVYSRKSLDLLLMKLNGVLETQERIPFFIESFGSENG